MGRTTFVGHPLHPQLILGPAGLFPFSFVMDLMHLTTGKQSYADAAYYSLVGGYTSGWAAAAAGFADYLEIPPQTPAKQVANLHGMLNVGMMGLYTINLMLRRRRGPGLLTAALSAVGSATLWLSAWYGGDLVYHHGVRVKGVSPIEKTPESKWPGDEKISERLAHLSEYAPAAGPALESATVRAGAEWGGEGI
ncbi:MAG TPA: DUF2231 domain-containing protein [Tepidisphaeraceae bacterium]|nr:DUF2231 domain-containing protein [Tepidisphaeraceae bacterium]